MQGCWRDSPLSSSLKMKKCPTCERQVNACGPLNPRVAPLAQDITSCGARVAGAPPLFYWNWWDPPSTHRQPAATPERRKRPPAGLLHLQLQTWPLPTCAPWTKPLGARVRANYTTLCKSNNNVQQLHFTRAGPEQLDVRCDLSSKSPFWAFHLESKNTSRPRFSFLEKQTWYACYIYVAT